MDIFFVIAKSINPPPSIGPIDFGSGYNDRLLKFHAGFVQSYLLAFEECHFSSQGKPNNLVLTYRAAHHVPIHPYAVRKEAE